MSIEEGIRISVATIVGVYVILKLIEVLFDVGIPIV